MLTLKKPVQLKCRRDIRTVPDTLGARIQGNYQMVLMQITPEDFLHLVTVSPKLYGEEGNKTQINIRNLIQNREIHFSVLNQLLNRVILYGSSQFTYGDMVYVDNVLRKIGVSNPGAFLREIKETQHLEERRNQVEARYLENWERLRETSEWLLEQKQDKEILGFFEKNDASPSRYYLQEKIYRQYDTAGLSEMVFQYGSPQRYAQSLQREAFRSVQQLKQAELILLQEERNRLAGQKGGISCELQNPYEFALTLPEKMTEQTVRQEAASAVLWQLLADFMYLQKTCGKDDRKEVFWSAVSPDAYQSVGDTLQRFLEYHRNPERCGTCGYSQTFGMALCTELEQLYHQEIYWLDQFCSSQEEELKLIFDRSFEQNQSVEKEQDNFRVVWNTHKVYWKEDEIEESIYHEAEKFLTEHRKVPQIDSAAVRRQAEEQISEYLNRRQEKRKHITMELLATEVRRQKLVSSREISGHTGWETDKPKKTELAQDIVPGIRIPGGTDKPEETEPAQEQKKLSLPLDYQEQIENRKYYDSQEGEERQEPERLSFQESRERQESERLLFQESKERQESERLSFQESRERQESERLSFQESGERQEPEHSFYEEREGWQEPERSLFQESKERQEPERLLFQESRERQEPEHSLFQRMEQAAIEGKTENISGKRPAAQSKERAEHDTLREYLDKFDRRNRQHWEQWKRIQQEVSGDVTYTADTGRIRKQALKSILSQEEASLLQEEVPSYQEETSSYQEESEKNNIFIGQKEKRIEKILALVDEKTRIFYERLLNKKDDEKIIREEQPERIFQKLEMLRWKEQPYILKENQSGVEAKTELWNEEVNVQDERAKKAVIQLPNPAREQGVENLRREKELLLGEPDISRERGNQPNILSKRENRSDALQEEEDMVPVCILTMRENQPGILQEGERQADNLPERENRLDALQRGKNQPDALQGGKNQPDALQGGKNQPDALQGGKNQSDILQEAETQLNFLPVQDIGEEYGAEQLPLEKEEYLQSLEMRQIREFGGAEKLLLEQEEVSEKKEIQKNFQSTEKGQEISEKKEHQSIEKILEEKVLPNSSNTYKSISAGAAERVLLKEQGEQQRNQKTEAGRGSIKPDAAGTGDVQEIERLEREFLGREELRSVDEKVLIQEPEKTILSGQPIMTLPEQHAVITRKPEQQKITPQEPEQYVTVSQNFAKKGVVSQEQESQKEMPGGPDFGEHIKVLENLAHRAIVSPELELSVKVFQKSERQKEALQGLQGRNVEEPVKAFEELEQKAIVLQELETGQKREKVRKPEAQKLTLRERYLEEPVKEIENLEQKAIVSQELEEPVKAFGDLEQNSTLLHESEPVLQRKNLSDPKTQHNITVHPAERAENYPGQKITILHSIGIAEKPEPQKAHGQQNQTMEGIHRLNLIHKQEPQAEEPEQEARKKDQIITAEKTEVRNYVTEERVITNQLNQWKQEILGQETHKIQQAVEQGIQMQIDRMADKVYGKLERRLQSERKRRGY